MSGAYLRTWIVDISFAIYVPSWLVSVRLDRVYLVYNGLNGGEAGGGGSASEAAGLPRLSPYLRAARIGGGPVRWWPSVRLGITYVVMTPVLSHLLFAAKTDIDSLKNGTLLCDYNNTKPRQTPMLVAQRPWQTSTGFEFDFLLGRFDYLGGRVDFRVGRFDPDTK